MKQHLLLSLLLSLSLFSLGQNIPSYVPTNGLVGWWPFNGNANDESGNGNHGVVNGATLTVDRFDNSARTYSFDGLDDYINIINPVGINFAVGQEFSISFWINADTTMPNTFAGLISKHALYNNQPYIGWQITRTRTFLAYETGTCVNQNIIGISHLSWRHYVYLFAMSSNLLHIFENGILVKTISCPTLSSEMMNNQYDLKFGVERNNTAYSKGKIDDIGIWNRALTQQEITNLYNASVPPPPCNSLPSNLQSGLVGYWPFCGNANDESGNGNHGTVNGATLTTDRYGNPNASYNFSNNTITIPHNSTFGFAQNGQQTISLWAKVTGSQSVQHFIGKRPDGAQQFNWQIAFNYPANIGISYTGSVNSTPSGVLSSYQPTLNTWINLICTYNSGKWSIYLNGSLLDSITTTLFYPDVACALTFGNSGSFEPFFGLLDDIAIWDRALSPSEVTQLYQAQSSNSNSSGFVGINMSNPTRNLHIKDVMKLEPRDTTPENPTKGDIYFDNIINKLRVYDGTTWQNCW